VNNGVKFFHEWSWYGRTVNCRLKTINEDDKWWLGQGR
jgi:hypothetical protein